MKVFCASTGEAHSRDGEFGVEMHSPAHPEAEDDPWYISPSELAAAVPYPPSKRIRSMTAAITEAGFQAGRIKQHDFFDMWSATFHAPQSLSGTTKQVRKFLLQKFRWAALPIATDMFIVSVEGKRGVVAFALPPEM